MSNANGDKLPAMRQSGFWSEIFKFEGSAMLVVLLRAHVWHSGRSRLPDR